METPLHLSIEVAQSAKRGEICGDVVQWERLPEATHVICADGQSSGMGAHIAATMLATRALELLRGFSMRQSFQRLVRSMNQARGSSPVYTAFSLLRMLPDGACTILSYEAPPAIIVHAGQQAQVLHQRTEMVGDAITSDAACQLRPGDQLLLMSDGITQAGLGMTMRHGWEPERIARFIDEARAGATTPKALAEAVHRQALRYWGEPHGDDCSVVIGSCRAARRVCLFTGPPASPAHDIEVVQNFMRQPGRKIVCGGTTANLLARVLHKKLEVIPGDAPGITPPAYRLRGIELVTEGAVTLNQLYNILDDDPNEWDESNPVTELARLLHAADRLDILMGTTRNPASNSQAQRQLGVLERHRIVPLLADKLREQGKTVLLTEV